MKIGDTFGRLTIIGEAQPIGNRPHWKCVCVCGTERVVIQKSLINGNTKSCGCLRKESVAEAHTTHGMFYTSEYGIWRAMVQRCTKPNSKDYRHYGGRGIKVCERWMNFDNFFADIGKRPDNLTLERKNNDGNYEPDNCVWATRKEQAANRRNTKE